MGPTDSNTLLLDLTMMVKHVFRHFLAGALRSLKIAPFGLREALWKGQLP